MSNITYQDEAWDEMLNGKIVLMSPRPVVNHNIVAGNIFHAFKPFLQGKSCMAFSDGVDVFLSKTDRVVPDIMIVCNRDIIKQNGIYGAADLMVEVLSPTCFVFGQMRRGNRPTSMVPMERPAVLPPSFGSPKTALNWHTMMVKSQRPS